MISNDAGSCIAVVGAHGAGKSTLVAAAKQAIRDSKASAVAFVGEVARHCPYKVGINPDPRAQPWIMSAQYWVEIFGLALGIPVVFDRCLLDQYAYFSYWGSDSPEWERRIQQVRSRYQRVFFLPGREEFLKDDGLRPVDIPFQKSIDVRIRAIIERLGPANVTTVDVMDRGAVNQVCSAAVALPRAPSATFRWSDIEAKRGALVSGSHALEMALAITTVVRSTGGGTIAPLACEGSLPGQLAAWLAQNGLGGDGP